MVFDRRRFFDPLRWSHRHHGNAAPKSSHRIPRIAALPSEMTGVLTGAERGEQHLGGQAGAERHPRPGRPVVEEVVGEITDPQQAAALQTAFAENHLKRDSLTDLDALALFAELVQMMGRGEAASLALADPLRPPWYRSD